MNPFLDINRSSVNRSKQQSFQGMHLDSYVKDLKILDTYGTKVKKLLPNKQNSIQNNTMQEIFNYINSKNFKINVARKNWVDKDENIWSMEYLKNSDFLAERADILLTKIYLNLQKIYKCSNEIVIPFSGGRDSTSLLAASLAFFPKKKYTLITVLNGMSENQENVMEQVKYIKQQFGKNRNTNIKHILIDASKNIQQHVITSAKPEAKKLGAPTICSSCKIVMEKEIWNYILNRKKSLFQKLFKNYPPILMGYTKNQQNQNWIEQTQLQINIMEREGKKFGIYSFSPLMNVIEEPYDSSLLLGALGIPLKHHKSEMKCFAGGLNPSVLDISKQHSFTLLKNLQTQKIPLNSNSIIYHNPNFNIQTEVSNKNAIFELKKNSQYLKNVFQVL